MTETSQKHINLKNLTLLDIMLPDTSIQEGLSFSYIKAVANIAGYQIDFPKTDFGTDAFICELKTREDGRTTNAGGYPSVLFVQIKSTHNFRESDTHISYDLRNKNYNDLTDTSTFAPKILVVLCMPEDKNEWVRHSVEELILKKCAYWTYLGGQPSVANTESTTVVHISKNRVFSPAMLETIMTKIRNQEDLNDI